MMKKKLISCVLAIIMVLTVCSFAACNEKAPDPEVYTVSVLNGTGGGQVTAATTTTLTADAAETGYKFSGWKVNGVVVSSDATYTFTPTANVTVIAVYELLPVTPDVYYQVTVQNGQGTTSVKEGTAVTVKANDAAEDYEFAGWKIGSVTVSQDPTYTFTPTADTTVVAEYNYTYEVYTGIVPESQPASYVVDSENFTVDINDAEAFAWWRSLIYSNTNGYTTLWAFSGNNSWTIRVNCNLDMAGVEWMPIDDECAIFDKATLDFTGHCIKNMYAVGHSALQDETTYRGWGSGGFFSLIGGGQTFTIQNLTFKNAKVVGTTGQLGVLSGGMYNATLTVNNVHVIDSIVDTSTGHKVGGLIGRVGNHESNGDAENLTIKNCSVENTTVAGMRNASALVGVIFSARATYIANTWGVYGAQFASEEGITVFANAQPDGMFNGIKILEDIDNHTYKLTLENNVVSDVTIVTRATTYQNASLIYNLSKAYFVGAGAGNVAVNGYVKAYDNTTNWTSYNTTKGAAAYGNNTVLNTKSYVKNYVAENGTAYYGLYPVTPEALSPVFEAYYYETEKDSGYDVRPIFVTVDLDLTALFESNPDWCGEDGITLPSTLKFVLVNGAKITGIPASVMGGAQIVNFGTLSVAEGC